MKEILTGALVLVFFALMVVVGIACRHRARNVDGFVLGGRTVGPWLTAFAFGTSYFSAVIFVGYAGQFGWNFGVASTWIGLGNAFIGSLLAWNILGRRTRLMTQHIGSRTMPDFFGKRYESDKLKVVASLIVFVFLIPYTASLYNGLSSLFGIAFDVPYYVCIIVMAALTGLYVIFGGYMATAVNDFIQGIIMLVGIVSVVVAVLNQNGGLMGSLGALATSESGGWEYTSFLGPDPVFLVTVVLLTSLGTWGLPQMVGKFYSITNESAIRKGTVISTFFAIVVAGGCYFLGGFGRLFMTQEEMGGRFDTVVPTMLANLPDMIVALVIVLVLAASMSTLSSLVLTSASTLALDVIAPRMKDPSEKRRLILVRLLVLFFIVLSAVIAILKDSIWSSSVFIAQMMGVSWGALAGAFLAPFLYGLYWKKTTRSAVVTSFILGVGIMVVQLLISVGLMPQFTAAPLAFIFKNSLSSGVFAMLCGLVVVPVVSLITGKGKGVPADVDEMFSCYDIKVSVPAGHSLADE